ncbi:MAG: endonuclease/exonuclease/phosphatase family protein [Candidatus Woesearchaeota archaeon]|jgi:endonuclease/exonuclease/phosphatase family metal-dependent hydrolase
MGKIKTILITLLIIIGVIVAILFWTSCSSNSTKVSPVITYGNVSIQPLPKNLTVMTYNVGYASGLDNNLGDVISESQVYRNLDLIAQAIEENHPDILVVQEIDFNSKRSHYINEFEYLQKKLNFKYATYIVNWDKHYVPYPIGFEVSKHFGKIQSGQAVFSHWPILENKAFILSKPESNPFWYNLFYIDRAVEKVKVELAPEKVIEVYNLHLESDDVIAREEQVGEVLKIKQNFTQGFILGDFNTLPVDAPQKNKFVDEPLTDFTPDQSYSILTEKSGLSPVTVSPNEFSFPSNQPTRRLDHLFYSSSFRLINSYVDQKAGLGSDHLPLVGVFEIS